MKNIVLTVIILCSLVNVVYAQEGEDVEFIDITDVYFEEGGEYIPSEPEVEQPIESLEEEIQQPIDEVSENIPTQTEGITNQAPNHSQEEYETVGGEINQDVNQMRTEQVEIHQEEKTTEDGDTKRTLEKESKKKDKTYLKAYRRWSETVKDYHWVGRTKTLVKKVPFKIIYQDDPDFKVGDDKVLNEGQEGEIVIELQQRVNDKGEGINVVLSEYLRKPPISKNVRRGTGETTKPYAFIKEFYIDTRKWYVENKELLILMTMFFVIALLLIIIGVKNSK